jgi:ATP-binding cassette subfamily F protein 3
VSLQASQRSGNIVLRTKDLVVGYPGTQLFTADDIELHRQECAALIGPNGTGKTTFLRTILEQVEPLAGKVQLGASLKIGYFAQAHNELNLENSVLDELLGQRNMPISEARNYLARYLFRADDVYKPVSALSGGERGRLALAILALEGANFLLLDEPTNHLDIPAQETLQEALEQFTGTILLVSHDRYLVDRLATQIWELRQNRLQVYEGNYQVYLAEREREKEAAKAEAAVTRLVADARLASNGGQMSKNALRRRMEEVEKLEASIHEKEGELIRLSEALQQATQAETFDKIQSLSAAYATAESQLATLLEKWEKVAHE